MAGGAAAHLREQQEFPSGVELYSELRGDGSFLYLYLKAINGEREQEGGLAVSHLDKMTDAGIQMKAIVSTWRKILEGVQ